MLVHSPALRFSRGFIAGRLDLSEQLKLGCRTKDNMAPGKEFHWLIARSGRGSDTPLGSKLIHTFTPLGCPLETNPVAIQVSPTSVSFWSTTIFDLAKLGQNQQALKLYYEMQKASMELGGHVFVAVLKACSNMVSLDQG